MNLLRDDLNRSQVQSTPVPDSCGYLGGRVINNKLTNNEVAPKWYAVGASMQLFLAAGLLADGGSSAIRHLSIGKKVCI